MAFMVPVVKKEWDIYGSSAKSRRDQQRSASSSRSTSEAGRAASRQASFGSRPAGSLSSSPPADGAWPRSGRHSGSSSRGSQMSQLAGSPPARGEPLARSQPTSGGVCDPSAAVPSTFGGYHTRFIDKMMRTFHRSDGSRKSGHAAAGVVTGAGQHADSSPDAERSAAASPDIVQLGAASADADSPSDECAADLSQVILN